MKIAGTDADLIDALVGITPGSPLDAIRARSPEARARAQATYRALFAPEAPGNLTPQERFAAGGSVPRRGIRARAHARLSPARRRAGGAAGAAVCRVVHDRHRDALPDRRLPVLPDPGGHWIAHPGRPSLTREVPI